MLKEPGLAVFFMLVFAPLFAQVEVSDSVLLGIGVNPKFDEKLRDKDRSFGIDFTGLGISYHFVNRVKNDLWSGIEMGLLPDKWDWVIAAGKKISQESTVWSKDMSEAKYNDINQLIFLHFLIQWKPTINWFEAETGLRGAIYDRNGLEIDSPTFDIMLGGYFKPMIGLKKIKLGTRMDFGIVNVSARRHPWEFILIATPLLRINFR